ncbi:hypothetical protein [Sulfobacillus thermosulfidooxidans]|uniref:hypothetical protein n=1 Tax=Sulfobacillus thermosulfidooxidans TaxID=28034 RepID=UPI0002F24903|nr:hypothetical protein [Sulfobacillus thermosulfidooxidans]
MVRINGLIIVDVVDGHLRGVENMFECTGWDNPLAMQRNDRITLGIITMADQEMTTGLSHTHKA